MKQSNALVCYKNLRKIEQIGMVVHHECKFMKSGTRYYIIHREGSFGAKMSFFIAYSRSDIFNLRV